MVAINVINALLNIIARAVIIFFGVANIIGIIWFLATTNLVDIVRGSIFILSSFIIGLSSISIFKGRAATFIYVAICLLGIISSLLLSLKNFFEEYGGLYAYLVQLIIIACFTFMMVRKIIIENKKKPE
jgi:hypothetical protein